MDQRNKLKILLAKGKPLGLTLLAAVLLLVIGGITRPPTAQARRLSAQFPFSLALAADMREFAGPGTYDTSQYFRGAVEAIATHGGGAFMISPGDIDPPADVYWTITNTLDLDYRWYPLAGNHETETPEDMAYLRAYDYGPVNPGPSGCPETTYSFDYSNVHFVVLNEYCDASGDTASAGDIRDLLYNWLASDLTATHQEHILVFGHEPAYPQPDADNGRLRHETDSLNAYPANRNRFWNLLKEHGVTAYFCGHTHNYSLVQVDGVWQMDVGHARGLGDTGAPSTFAMIQVQGPRISYGTYRTASDGGTYVLDYSGELTGLRVYLPVVQR